MAWKRGMPIEVLPDGHQFSARELLPPAQGGSFARVIVTDLTDTQVEQAMSVRWGSGLCEMQVSTVAQEPTSIARRLFKLRVDDLPLAVRSELNTTGVYTTTWAAVRTFIQNSATLENT